MQPSNVKHTQIIKEIRRNVLNNTLPLYIFRNMALLGKHSQVALSLLKRYRHEWFEYLGATVPRYILPMVSDHFTYLLLSFCIDLYRFGIFRIHIRAGTRRLSTKTHQSNAAN